MGSSFAPCQSSITAYARHGRHCSDRRSSSRAVQPPAMRCRTKSPLGNASGSPNALIAMYCAVHGPIPGSACSTVVTFSALDVVEKVTDPAHTARASVRIVSARAAITPTSSIGAVASCSAAGKIRSSPSVASTAVPKRVATRPAMVVAAATDICWPRMARTDSSKPSHAPGVRMPACRFRIWPSSRSPPSCSG